MQHRRAGNDTNISIGLKNLLPDRYKTPCFCRIIILYQEEIYRFIPAFASRPPKGSGAHNRPIFLPFHHVRRSPD
jgi:hypothetical protein